MDLLVIRGLGCLILGFVAVSAPAGAKANSTVSNGAGAMRQRRQTDSQAVEKPFLQTPCSKHEPFKRGRTTWDRRDGHNISAHLHEKMSACCGLKEYNPLNEICCESTVVLKPAPMAECCGKVAYDSEKKLCCGPHHNRTILTKNSSNHRCCLHGQYDHTTECCCPNEDVKIQLQPHCCLRDLHLVKEMFHNRTHMSCGPIGNKTILEKKSIDHRCCGSSSQYNIKTECCCLATFEVQQLNSRCCIEESNQTPEMFHNRTHMSCGPIGNKTILEKKSIDHRCCGSSSQYNIKTECCCLATLEVQQKNSRCCIEESNRTPGHHDSTSSMSNPTTQISSDGHLSQMKSWMDRWCGGKPYGLAQRGVLCCNNTLYKDREDGEECSETGRPYNPTKVTICGSKEYKSSGQHCCGSELYQPQDFICCNGHRHRKSETLHCCGAHAYHITDPSKKCCAGKLYNLESKDLDKAQCCGSFLQRPEEVCCSSEDRQILYSNRTGLRCCGHHYYNTSLWSCCAGRLSPVTQPGHNQNTAESILPSVNNLNKTELCTQINVGIVESVSVNNTVFRNVLKISGGNESVKAVAGLYILQTQERCRNLKLTPGRSYFFDEVDVFTDFNHDSVLQSLYFILSRCSQ